MENLKPFATIDISGFLLSAHARQRWQERHKPASRKEARKEADLDHLLKKARFLRTSLRKGTSYLCGGYVVYVKNGVVTTIYKPDLAQQAWAYR